MSIEHRFFRDPWTPEKSNQLKGWFDDALSGRVQGIAIGIYIDRDLWRFELHRFKGSLTLSLGPVFLDFLG